MRVEEAFRSYGGRARTKATTTLGNKKIAGRNVSAADTSGEAARSDTEDNETGAKARTDVSDHSAHPVEKTTPAVDNSRKGRKTIIASQADSRSPRIKTVRETGYGSSEAQPHFVTVMKTSGDQRSCESAKSNGGMKKLRSVQRPICASSKSRTKD